jgi:hypothetical protein
MQVYSVHTCLSLEDSETLGPFPASHYEQRLLMPSLDQARNSHMMTFL